MKHIDKVLAGLALVGAASCHRGDPNHGLGVGAKLSVDYLGDSDVVGFHYLIERVSCDPGDPIEPFSFEALVDLQDQLAPGGVTVLGVLDGESGHIFADVFVSLDPGCYDVTATPVQEMDPGAGTYTASDDCAAASADGVEVLQEETTDAPVLISQCEGDPIGGGDFPAALNHPPRFTLDIDDKFGFVCEVLEACASVSDPDNDPLELDWTQSAGGALYEPISIGALTQTGQEGGVRQYEQCAEFVSEAAGEYELSVTVYDLLGNGTRIEDALDPGQESHATLSFPLNTSTGVEPACIDGGGAVVPLGDPIDRRAGCSFQTDDQYYCDAANAAADGFDLNDTCPGGVFEPNAVYPACATTVYATSCADELATNPGAADGIYTIDPDGDGGLAEFDVECDMTTGGGGWTLVAFNDDPDTFVDFNRDWAEYRDGFGSLSTGANGWLGNLRLHAMTSAGVELHVRRDSGPGSQVYEYADFSVDDEAGLFGLSVSNTPSSNDAGQFVSFHGGLSFSTFDMDNDTSGINCAADRNAGWWYADCFAMSIASGTPGNDVYWINGAGGPAFVSDFIGMWIR